MALWGLALVLWSAAAAPAEVFEIGRVPQDGDEYTISSDYPARFLADGTPQLPVGAVVSVVDRAGASFGVLLAAPLSTNQARVRGRWAQTLSRSGLYRISFDAAPPAGRANFVFAVAGPDTDGDGIPDDQDLCPYDNPRGRDADQDGCPDTVDRLPALIARMILDPALKQELLYAAERASQAAAKGDKDGARALLREVGARATTVPGLDPGYRQLLRDFVANALVSL